MTLTVILCGALVALAAYFGLEALSVRQRQLAVSLRRARRYGRTGREGELTKGVSERVLAPSLAWMAQFATRFPMTASPDELRKRLIAAGYGQRISPQGFLAAKTGAAGGAVVFMLLLSAAGVMNPFTAVFLGLILGLALFMIPDFYLGTRTRGRKENIRIQMPDILDLLCVSVEAGLGFDAALAKVTERMEGPLVEEVSIMLQEMRIGEGRAQALKNLAERLDLPDVTSFARAIIQADQLGISLGRILRVQANDMRNRRQMAAEEKAMKVPVKMLFPTVIFIFPTMFIVVIGPAILSLVDVFSGAK